MYNPGMVRPSDAQPVRTEPFRFTYEDYLRFPDDGRRHELIDGEHVVTPAPTLRHQELLLRIASTLSEYLKGTPVGRVFPAPADVILSDRDVVQPDVLFVRRERSEILADVVRGAPDLAVEVVSPSTRRADELTKRRLYDRFGVQEYWIVDPEIEVVKIYRRRDAGTFDRPIELRREDGQAIESPLFPGFSLPLDDLFGESA